MYENITFVPEIMGSGNNNRGTETTIIDLQ